MGPVAVGTNPQHRWNGWLVQQQCRPMVRPIGMGGSRGGAELDREERSRLPLVQFYPPYQAGQPNKASSILSSLKHRRRAKNTHWHYHGVTCGKEEMFTSRRLQKWPQRSLDAEVSILALPILGEPPIQKLGHPSAPAELA